MWMSKHCSNIYRIFYVRPIFEIKWEHNEAVHQLFIDFKKAYDSVSREVFCNIVVMFCIPRKLVSLTECQNETCSIFRVGYLRTGSFHKNDHGVSG